MARRAAGDATGVATTLVTADGVRLHARVLGDPPTAPLTWAIGHGFTNSSGAPHAARIHRFLHARGDAVVATDFRGHGRSGGRSSVGRDEHLDTDAAVAFARDAGAGLVVVLGFSMGGAAALRQAALGEHRPDTVIAVSPPARWYIRDTRPMRLVHWMLEAPFGTLAGRARGVRLGGTWEELPPTPLELMDRIAPLPLLLVHGTADHYFGHHFSELLHRAAGHGDLWLEEGMGHAESGLTPDLLGRIHAWAHAIPRA